MFSEEYIITQAIKDISYNLGLDEDLINLETKFEDLDILDLEREEIIFDLEESFDIEILDEDFDRFQTIKDLVDFIKAWFS